MYVLLERILNNFVMNSDDIKIYLILQTKKYWKYFSVFCKSCIGIIK